MRYPLGLVVNGSLEGLLPAAAAVSKSWGLSLIGTGLDEVNVMKRRTKSKPVPFIVN